MTTMTTTNATVRSMTVTTTTTRALCTRCNGERQRRHEYADPSPMWFPDEPICSTCEAEVIADWRAKMAREDAEREAARRKTREEIEDDVCFYCDGSCLAV